MCLRYSLPKLALAAFNEDLGEAAEMAGDWALGYNIALTRRMPVLVKRPKPKLEALSFGLLLPARPPGHKPLIMGNARLPHYFTLQDRRPFFFAGLWEPERDDTPAAFCIVTTTANALLQPIHDRMPVILGPNSGPAWLGDEPLDPAQLARLCRPLPAEMMTGHRVDPRVNNVRYEAPDCITPI